MSHKEVIEFIHHQLNGGHSPDDIRAQLHKRGWKDDDIEQAFKEAGNGVIPGTMPSPVSVSRPAHHTNHSTNRKRKAVIAAVVIGILVLAGGAYAAYRWYQSPARVGKQMIQNISTWESNEFSIQIIPHLSETANDNTSLLTNQIEGVQFDLTGAVAVDDAGAQRVQAQGTLTLSQQTGADEKYTAEARSIDSKTLYLKADALPGIATNQLSVIKDKWVAIDLEQLQQYVPLEQSVVDLLQPNTPLTADEQQQVRTAFVQHPFMQLNKKQGTEDIHGVKTAVYPVTIDPEEARAFITAIEPIVEKHTDTKSLMEQMEELLNHLDSTQITASIGRKDNQLYALHIVIDQPDANVEKMEMTMQFWNHNQPVNIVPPEDALTIQEVIRLFIQGQIQDRIGGGTTEENTPEEDEEEDDTAEEDTTNETPATDADDDGLTDTQESTYGTNPAKSDTDGDGYADGEEVQNGYNPVGEGKL